MNVKGRVSEVPKPLRQLMQRLPVGRSEVFLNELAPHNQLSFLARCMEQDRQKKGQREESVNAVRGFRFVGQNMSKRSLLHTSDTNDVRGQGRDSSSTPCTSASVLNLLETRLCLPLGSSGRLEAFRPPPANYSTKSFLFFLAVPRRIFKTAEGGDANLSVEAVLRRHLLRVKRTLYWREDFSSFDIDEWGEDANTVASDTPDVMLEKIWGCTVPQLRRAGEIAQEHDYRVFLLGYARQRLMSNMGPMVRELGNLCPAAFRGFHLDVRSVEPPEKSTHFSALLLLEEAKQGFLAGCDKAGSFCSEDQEISRMHSGAGDEWMEYALSFAVAEVVVDAKRDALVPWDRVSDNPITARLFEALYERRHSCVADAVLHASQRVVLPFLLCETPPSSSLSSSTGVSRESNYDTLPLRLLRWSELHTLLRWRLFAPVFGPLSQVVRTEDVAAVGGGLDPFIFPMHEAFVVRVLLPLMSAYHRRFAGDAEDVVRSNAGRSGVNAPVLVTVDILECFSSVTNNRNEHECGCRPDKSRKKAKKQPKASSSWRSPVESGGTHFTLEDLPALVKYLLYFNEHFDVTKSATGVTFALTKDQFG